MASSPIPFIRTIRAFGFPFLSTVARVIAFGSLTCHAIASSNHFLKRVTGSSGRLTSGSPALVLFSRGGAIFVSILFYPKYEGSFPFFHLILHPILGI